MFQGHTTSTDHKNQESMYPALFSSLLSLFHNFFHSQTHRCVFQPLVVVAFSFPVEHYCSTITDMLLEVEQIAVLMGLFSKRCVAFFSPLLAV